MKATLTLTAIILLSLPVWAGDHQDKDNPKARGQANAVMHGKKKGWRGCNLPPGQAKKYGCGVPVRATPPPPPPPPPVRTVVVTPPAVRVVIPPPPPPPSVGVQVHVDAVIHP